MTSTPTVLATSVARVPEPWRAQKGAIEVHARYLGRRLDTRDSPRARRTMGHPLRRRIGEGLALLFPYGVVVAIDLTAAEEHALLQSLEVCLEDPFSTPVSDEVTAHVGLGAEGLDDEGRLRLAELDEDRLELVGDVLAKSVVLEHFEQSIGRVFEQIHPLAIAMERTGHTGPGSRELVRLIGHAMLVRQETVWRVEVDDEPDAAWDWPDLDRLWMRLSETYELRERHNALGRKVDLLSQSASTLLEVLHSKRSLRVEWYVVALIVVEILLTLVQMLGGR